MSKNPLLDDLARVCKAAYVRERQRWDAEQAAAAGIKRTVRYVPSPKWEAAADGGGSSESAWLKMAKFMLKHQLDPERCVQLRFAIARGATVSHVPMPNNVAIDKYLKDYTCAAEDAKVTSESALRTRVAEAAACVQSISFWQSVGACSMSEAVRTALLDPSLQVGALTRYCLAYHEGFEDLQKQFEQAAMAQYAIAPTAYDAAWQNRLPDGFVRTARTLCRYTGAVT